MTPNDIATANAFHDAQGAAWGVIEGAGMEDGDRWVGRPHKSMREASTAIDREYTPEEIDDMPVRFARWDREGEFWTYDY